MAKQTKQPKPAPADQAEAAKAALLVSEAHKPSQIEQFIKAHTWETVGLALLGGFLITALKPGRTMLRQTAMMGLSIGARRLLMKYLGS